MNSMKTCAGFVVMAALLGTCAGAASLPASLRDETLLRSESLNRLSVGVGFEDISRDVEVKRTDGLGVSRFVTELAAESGAFNLGVDLLPWMTVFGTMGVAELDDEAFDSGAKWSAGLGLNLWRHDVTEPAFMAGRLMIKSAAEYTSYESDSDTQSADWIKVDAALTVGYEMFDESETENTVSLNLFLGPIFSWVDGEIRGEGERVDFESDNSLGAVFGADVRITRHLLLGVQGEYFDGTTFLATVRFHF